MSLPWSTCMQTFSETKNTHIPMIQRPSQDGVGVSEFRTSLTRSSMIGRAWQVFYGDQVKCHIIRWLWTGEKEPCQVLWLYGDILVCIFCLDPQMACFLPISAGVYRSKPHWIHQTVEDKLCSSLSALTNKQLYTVKGCKRYISVLESGNGWKWVNPCSNAGPCIPYMERSM